MNQNYLGLQTEKQNVVNVFLVILLKCIAVHPIHVLQYTCMFSAELKGWRPLYFSHLKMLNSIFALKNVKTYITQQVTYELKQVAKSDCEILLSNM